MLETDLLTGKKLGFQEGKLQSKRKCEAVILTAISDEFLAVRSHLSTPIDEEVHSTGTIYRIGNFKGWPVAVAVIGERNTVASRETEKAISHLNPRVAIFLGIAGGRKDVALGDVVVATKIYDYETGKAEAEFKPRPITRHATHRIMQRAMHEANEVTWLSRIKEPVYTHPPKVFAKPIASGTKVISSKKSEVAKLINQNCGDAVAVEMEGFGFLETVFEHRDVEALVVRGISDLIEGKHKSDSAGYQLIASQHASAFVFEVLAKVLPDISPPPPPPDNPFARLADEVLSIRVDLGNLQRTFQINDTALQRLQDIYLKISRVNEHTNKKLESSPTLFMNVVIESKTEEVLSISRRLVINFRQLLRDKIMGKPLLKKITVQRSITSLALSLKELETDLRQAVDEA